MITEIRSNNPHLAPRRPRMLVDKLLDMRQYRLGAAHHSAADYDQFRIVSVNQADSSCSPDLQAIVANLGRHAVSCRGKPEEGPKVDRLLFRQRAVMKTLPLFCHDGEGPTRSFRLTASDRPTSASTSADFRRQVSAQASRLRVLSPEQFALNHRGSADPSPECDHHDVVRATRGSRMAFTQECHARIVLDGESKSKLFRTPSAEIDTGCIFIFLVGRDHTPGARIRKAAKPERDAETFLRLHSQAFQKSADYAREKVQNGAKIPCMIERDVVAGEHIRTLNDRHRGVRAS